MSQTQESILATMILFPAESLNIIPQIDESWFTGLYRKAFNYICDNDGSDVVSIASGIGAKASEVMKWADAEFSLAFIHQHIKNLEREATLRKIKYLSKQLAVIDDTDEAGRLIERFQASIASADKSEPVGMETAITSFSKDLEEKYNRGGQLLGATTGLQDLDEKTEGLHTGDLVIVAAPSSMGKTALALSVAEAVAFSGKGDVLFFSFEMSIQQLIARWLAGESKVPMQNIRSGRLDDRDWPKMLNAFGRMKDARIWFDDPAGLTISQVIAKIRSMAKKGVKYVFIDYLQIMRYDKKFENTELDIITCALKGAAKELGICVILLSQLNRGNIKEKRKPTMHDLRGSGTIENHADVVIFPWREAAYCVKCQEKVDDYEHNLLAHQTKAEIIIGKQRQGERNIAIPVAWCGEQTRFKNMELRR